ncbi:MAG: type II secretion system F family protein [Candidatus Nanoarchaeia archaeon]|nr:type II secretion system F family protein [Candidatus Nanoarchaeia archaeon]
MNIQAAKSSCKEIIDKAELLKAGKIDKKAAVSSVENALSLIETGLSLNPAEKIESSRAEPVIMPAVSAPIAEEKKAKAKKGKFKPSLSIAQKSRYLEETNLTRDMLKDFAEKKKKRIVSADRVAYTLYSTNEYGKFANRFFEPLTIKLTSMFGKELQNFYKDLRASGIKVLSKTYISMIFLSSVIAFLAVTLLASVFYSAPNIIIQVLRGIFIGIIGAGITAVVMYFYPSSIAKTKETAIKADLPFVIINMAAVAGSGAKPISIFKTILSSDEYPGLRDEIKKIVNYVNLFGYDLSTALRAVARDTPALRFKDLLDGIVNTISSGGDLKEYLNSMADEALTTYKLERQKAVEQVGTYSDIYTTICIAAPLLFFVTLAIIQTMGGEIGGVSVASIATIGTYGVIPLLNVGFIVFMSAVQPKG